MTLYGSNAGAMSQATVISSAFQAGRFGKKRANLARFSPRKAKGPGGDQINFIKTSIQSGANFMCLPVIYIGLGASLHISIN